MAGKIYIGNSTISKMYLGQNEVSKVYLGQDLVYEKQASGFDVSISNMVNTTGNAFYSLDNGTTWIDIGDSDRSTIDLTGVIQIMFKVDNPHVADWGRIRSTQLNLYLDGDIGPKLSQNYILTQNLTDVEAYTYYD